MLSARARRHLAKQQANKTSKHSSKVSKKARGASARRRPLFRQFRPPNLQSKSFTSQAKRSAARGFRSPIQIEQDDARIAEMYRKGRTLYQIGKVIGISTKLVQRRMVKIRDEWKRRAMRAMEEHLAEELDKLDYVEREALEAWERSQEDAKTVETTMRVTKALQGNLKQTPRGTKAVHPRKMKTSSVKVEGQVGDARFLMLVRDCVSKRAELLGLAGFNKPADPDKPYETQEDVRTRIAAKLASLAQPQQTQGQTGPNQVPGTPTVQ